MTNSKDIVSLHVVEDSGKLKHFHRELENNLIEAEIGIFVPILLIAIILNLLLQILWCKSLKELIGKDKNRFLMNLQLFIEFLVILVDFLYQFSILSVLNIHRFVIFVLIE